MAIVNYTMEFVTPPAVVLEYMATRQADPADQTTLSFTAESWGDAAADRVLIVAGQGHCWQILTKVEFIPDDGPDQGVATEATVVAGTYAPPNQQPLVIVAALMPTGTSGEIKFTGNTSAFDTWTMSLWRATGVSATPTDSDYKEWEAVTAPAYQEGTVTVPSGGFAIYAGFLNGGDDVFDVSGSVTQDFKQDTASYTYMCNYRGHVTAAGDQTIGIKSTAHGTYICKSAIAAFGPA